MILQDQNRLAVAGALGAPSVSWKRVGEDPMSLLIRLATPEDGAALAAIYAPAVTERATSFELSPPTAADMAERIAHLRSRFPWLVVASGASVLGYAYASPHRDRAAYAWSVDVSAYVREDVHRAGVGRALYTSLFAVLALQGFRQAYAGVTLPNPASVGLHEAVGFRLVGTYRNVGYKLRRWHDVAWFSRQLSPLVPDPPTPRPLMEVSASPAFLRAMNEGLTHLRVASLEAALRASNTSQPIDPD
jgi:phosphinothricin acetyltransferase